MAYGFNDDKSKVEVYPADEVYNKNEVDSEIAAVNSRVNNIIAGAAPSAQEIIDARFGDDGVVYPSLGDAIRTQVGDLKSDINHFFENGSLVDASANTSGYYISKTTGKLNANASYFTTDYLPVNPDDKIVFSTSVRFLAGFLADKTIEASAGTENITTYTVPANVKYIRVSAYIDFLNSFDAYPSNSWDGFKPYGLYPIEESFDPLVGKCISSLGADGFTSKFNLPATTTKEFNEGYPWYNKVGDCIAFKGYFSEFSALWIGKGYYRDYGAWLEINGTNVSIKRYLGGVINVNSWAHGLTMDEYIYVIINTNDKLEVQITVGTKGGRYTITPTRSYDFLSLPFVRSALAMTDCTFSITCEYFKSPLWIFGDSYWGLSADRIYGALRQLGYPKCYINNLPGQTSQGAYNDFAKAIKFGKPKYLVWALGINDSNLDNYKKFLSLIATSCAESGTELIVAKMPSIPNGNKTSQHSYIDDMGFRSVDLNGAVGATSSGVWYDGMLSSDNTHPTELGAKMLSMQMFVDVPEIANYGKLG